MQSTICRYAPIGTFSHECGKPATFATYRSIRVCYCAEHAPADALLLSRAEDLLPEGIQLVIPGAERIQPASVKQGDLF